MATRNITISTGSVTFNPPDLSADVADNVTWANETNAPHQIAVGGVPVTDVIQPWNSSTQYSVPSSVTYNCLIHPSEVGKITVTALLVVLLLSFFAPSARAQHISCTELLNQDLPTLPEIAYDSDNVLRGTLISIGQKERIASVLKSAGRKEGLIDPKDLQCDEQWVRTYIVGTDPLPSQKPDAPPTNPLPGPVLRARVGGLVEMTFLNEIEKLRFGNADRTKCDQVDMGQLYPGTEAGSDKFPDCFNESIYTNVHYHGTHTNPNSTGDNVFLQLMPSPRSDDDARTPVVTMESVRRPFAEFFHKCETQLTPNNVPIYWPVFYSDLPQSLQDMQDDLLKKYAPTWYAQNQQAIKNGAFPQNYVGAFPYCYRLPVYTDSQWPPAPASDTSSAHSGGAGSAEMHAPPPPLIMGQAPGTHWYHAHKHGSTTINVSNGMTGVMIVEGEYDDEIKKGYPEGIKQQVLVINQLSVQPLMETNAAQSKTAVAGGPYFSVNGGLQPVIRMKAGEVQWWRIANTSSRAGAYFLAPEKNGLQWKQLAQDGVQFNEANYKVSNNQPFLLMSGNRADLLVKAPPLNSDPKKNTYAVLVYNTVDPSDRSAAKDPVKLTLLNVQVEGPAKEMKFLAKAPTFPKFLADIDESEIKATRVLTFSTTYPAKKITPPKPPAQHKIDGRLFDGEVGAVVLLNQREEWKVVNETYPNGPLLPISHPFHIHINPFQIVEVFDPNATIPDPKNKNKTLPKYIFYKKKDMAKGQCYLDPHDSSTWKPCTATAPSKDRIWWDVFAIPSGKIAVDSKNNPIKDKKGKQIGVPGYFKMRSRFVDYSGYYVLHCHILAHEDRGMMTVVYVTPLQPPFSHH